MEFIDLIHKRRSVREFVDRPISDADLKIILSAGMTAPSAMNKQPWEFIVVTDEEKKKLIPEFSPYASMTLRSPLSILVCGDKNKSYQSYYVVDCAAAVQNMLLAASALGIGSVWTGVWGDNGIRCDKFKELFDLPAFIEPIAYIVFGYPKNEFEKKDYFDEKKIHVNGW